MNAVLYLSLASFTVLPVLIRTKKLRRTTSIAAWTAWSFFAVVLCVYLTVFLVILIEEMD